jgi:hypothetical protein
MTNLPPDIKEIFFKTIIGDIHIKEFEKWAYESEKLSHIMNNDDYLELISFNFNKSGADYELYHILKKHIDISEFETYRFRELLLAAKKKDERLPDLLLEFWFLYTDGYDFLEDLGFGYGMYIENPPIRNGSKTWYQLSAKKQKKILDSFSPGLEESIETVLDWINEKKIVLTGQQDDHGNYIFIDYRSEEERISKLMMKVDNKIEKNNSTTTLKQKNNNLSNKWWQFWK